MLRGLWTLCVLVVMTALLGTPTLVASSLAPGRSDVVMHLGRIWAAALLRASGARVHYHGLERARGTVPCLFVANHQSSVDIWALLRVLPSRARFVAKQELFRIPLFGWILAATGFVPIDRGNRSEAIRSLDRAALAIGRGRSLVLFPEGTRSRDGRLQPFKKGAFHLALRSGAPIVPVAIAGSFEVMPRSAFPVRPGRVDVWFEPPIDVAAFRPDGHDELRRTVHEAIARRLGDAAPRPVPERPRAGSGSP
jgi:1-acyl-sn-glycerol-3-phosphate acyltransferase